MNPNRGISTNKWFVTLFKSVNVIKNPERLRKYSWLKNSKEIWQLKAMNDPKLDPGLKKRLLNNIIGKASEILM